MVEPMFGAADDEWVTLVGRYILNMGAFEMASRLLIAGITGNNQHPVLSESLAARIGYLRKRFPRGNHDRHSWAMNAFVVANKHAGVRNAVAHSPVALTSQPDGTYKIEGILNLTPKSSSTAAELISLEEIRSRVDESAKIAKAALEMQQDFGCPPHT